MSTDIINRVHTRHYIVKKGAVDNETIRISCGHKCNTHQISIEAVTGAAAAGTITIKARPIGISTFQTISGGVISAASPTPVVFNGQFEEIQAIPAGLDSGYTYDIVFSGQ